MKKVHYPQHTFLNYLLQIEKSLPQLLAVKEGWNSLYIDYERPLVGRVWRQHDELRISLHRISSSEKSFFHTHPWPAAMRILKGKYEMGVGYGKPQVEPTVATTLILNEGAAYEMITPNTWHYVRPLTEVSYSLMVSGVPWVTSNTLISDTLNELSIDVKIEILEFFKAQYPKNKT